MNLRPRTTFAFALLATLLAIGSLGLWIESYWYGLTMRTEQWPAEFSASFMSHEGSTTLVLYLHEEGQVTEDTVWEFDHYDLSKYSAQTGWSDTQWMGFGLTWMEEGEGSRYSDLVVPTWAWAVWWIAWTVVMWRHWAREHIKLMPGRCRGCGYDLTGNTSGECPECGRLAPLESGDKSESGAAGAEGGAEGGAESGAVQH